MSSVGQRKFKWQGMPLAAVLSLLVAQGAHATNGYFTLGYSAKDKGVAGANTARGSDALSMANNPATLMQVADRLDLSISFFSPKREYTVSGEPSLGAGFEPVIGGFPGCAAPGQSPCQVPFSTVPGTVESDREQFFIPNVGYTQTLKNGAVLGLAVYGNGGMNTTYKEGGAVILDPVNNRTIEAPGTFGGGRAGVDLAQVFANVSYGWRVNEQLDLGVGLVVAAQRFEAYGLAPLANVSLAPENLTDRGHDWSYGVGLKFGLNYHVSETLSLGATYQTETRMTKFDDYSGLFARGGDFDIPATYSLGLAWKTSDTSTLLLDYQGIEYGGVAAVSNSISTLFGGQCLDALNNGLFNGEFRASGEGCLGGQNGAGFGWRDMHVVKLGYEWKRGKGTYRLGYSTTNQPIRESEVNFNILAPGVIEQHFTAGYSRDLNGNEWTFYAMYAPTERVSGTSLLDPNQQISFEMKQYELGFAVSF